MLRRLIAFLLGHLRIEVRSDFMETFLNLALEEGIHLWAIERSPDRMRASLLVRDFWLLRPVARGARARVRILQRHGWPFRAARLQRRPILIGGAIACLGFLVWATGHVWIIDVKVTGPQNVDARAVKAAAEEAGLRFGVWKSKVDTKKVTQHLQNRIGQLSWAGLRIEGTRAVIEVVEKAVKHPEGQVGCVNLVAKKDGVVERIIPFVGEPVVKRGDIVKAGDLLVECSFRYWGGGRPSVFPGMELPPRESVARTAVAQAQIKARITHTKYTEIPLVREEKVPTGESSKRWVLNWNGKTILDLGNKAPAYPSAQVERKSYSLGSWRNWKSPVELVILNTEAVEVRQERIPLEKALTEAKEQFAAQLRWILGPADKMLTPVQVKVAQKGQDFVGVTLSVETLEEIASPVPGAPRELTVPEEPAKP